MPRIRFLTVAFFKDEDLAFLPHKIRLFFAGLGLYADRNGRLEDRPAYLKAELLPYEEANTDMFLNILANPGIPNRPGKYFIRRYEVNGRRYIDIPCFLKHQRPHHTEKQSSIPPCPENYTMPDFTHPSKKTPKNKSDKDISKNLYGEFVKLTKEQYDKLLAKFGELKLKEKIEGMNLYIGSKGKDYDSHYHTLLSWERNKGKNGNSGKPTKPPTVHETKSVETIKK